MENVALALHGQTEVKVGNNLINFQRPWQRYTMFEAIEKYTGVHIADLDEAGLREAAQKLHVHLEPSMGKAKIIDEIFGEHVEPKLIQPTFITDYPVEMSPAGQKAPRPARPGRAV